LAAINIDQKIVIMWHSYQQTSGEIEDVLPPDAGAFERIKRAVNGHGEKTILPDDCQFGDNNL